MTAARRRQSGWGPTGRCDPLRHRRIALAALRTLAPQQRRVVLPAYTRPLVAAAMLRAGLTTRLCDTRPGHFDFDPGQLADCCGRHAGYHQHAPGQPRCRRGAGPAPAASCGAFVIEVVAQAFGAQAKGTDGAWHSLGLAGDIGAYSFSVGTGLTSHEGGLSMGARCPRARRVGRCRAQPAATRAAAGTAPLCRAVGLCCQAMPRCIGWLLPQAMARVLAAQHAALD
jgi:hypothetical protein